MTKLEINKKAAELCGVRAVIHYGIVTTSPNHELTDLECGELGDVFNIFTSAADREATVIALGEKYCIVLSCIAGEHWHAFANFDGIEAVKLTDKCKPKKSWDGTYLEALVAAVKSVEVLDD